MLNRPSFSIRRLISTRGRPLPDQAEGVSYDIPPPSSQPIPQRRKRSKSWVPQSRRKSSATSDRDRRGHSVHRSADSPCSSRIPLPKSSSSNSLHRSDKSADYVAREGSTDSRPALNSFERGRTNSHSTTPKRPPRPKEGLFGSEELNILGSKPQSPAASLNNSDLRQPEPLPTPIGEAVSSYNDSPEPWSDNIQQLIRETDEAFKAVGSALTDEEFISRGFESFDTNITPPPVPRRQPRPMPLSAGSLREQRTRDTLPSSPLASPTRRASVKKSKKKKKTTPHKPGYHGDRHGKTQVKAPRWTLSPHVTEILTGQRFKRIEADEMLTSEQLEALKQQREKARLEEEASAPRQSSDSSQTQGSDMIKTPDEPFHYQDLPLRIVAAGVKTTITPVEPAPPSLPDGYDVIHQDFSISNDAYDKQLDSVAQDLQEESGNTSVLIASPTPPPKNPARFNTVTQNPHGHLSTIPEVMVTTPGETQLQPSTHRPSLDNGNFRAEETDEFVYLKSTPFTLTWPEFRHGPITFPKSEVGTAVKTIDDTLDWTAFQMAILGGAGELSPDMTAEEDAKQAEDISAWFDSFGFETHGRLVSGDSPPPSPRNSSQSEFSSSTPSTVDAEVDLPIPVLAEYPSGFWNISTARRSIETLRFYNSHGIRRRTAETRPRRYTTHHEESLPPSPMMPLFTGNACMNGDGTKENVPMGYNLGHDLGDFLRWEAEHVHGGGFYYGTP